MKKLLSLVLLLTLSFTFSACGDSDEEPEKFKWSGDWNNPNDPNYKPEYGGKYNPIQGLWRRNSDGTRGLYFSEDFKAYTVTFYSGGRYVKDEWRDYVINNKAFSNSPPASELWRYKIEEDKLWITPNMNDDNDWRSFTKVKE